MRSNDEAKAILQRMRHQAGTLFRALDKDGDGKLSPSEIKAAPEVLKSLGSEGDGWLTEGDFGGPTHIPGMVRRSSIVRVLDHDGDLRIGPDDIAAAPQRILELDANGDGWVTADDDLPPLGSNVEMMMPMGTMADRLAFQEKMFSREPTMTGRLMPTGDKRVQPGFLLIQEVNDRGDVQKSSRTILMDENGKTVHSWSIPEDRRLSEATVSYLLDNGHLLRTMSSSSWIEMDGQFPIGANGTIVLQAPDSAFVWEWNQFEPGAEALHHDIELMPNGNILAISWDIMPADEAIGFGWRPQTNRAGDARDRIILDKIVEIAPDFENGGGEIVWQWAFRDHLIQDTNPSAANFGDPADHPGRLDVNWPQLSELQFNSGQLLHTNAVSYCAKDDVILLSCAALGEIFVIDHSLSTEDARGPKGDFLWRWGNPQTQKRGDASDQVLFWQHDAHWLEGSPNSASEILLFNNGMRRTAESQADPEQICMGLLTGAFSNVVQMTLPRDETGRLIKGEAPRIDWQFNEAGQHDVYSPFMSNAQRLPNGNCLMCEGSSKRILEVTSEGDIVLDFFMGGPGRLYRVYKYAPDHPGIKALGL